MTKTVAVTILGVLTLLINYTNLLLVFPRRLNNILSISLPILFTTVFYTILLSTGTMSEVFGGFRGFIHLPLLLLLLKGQFFQKLFGVIFQMLLAGFQLAAAKMLAITFAPEGSEQYYMLYVSFTLVLYIVYVFVVIKFGRSFMVKLFFSGRLQEWAVYSLGALFSFTIFAITFETVTITWLYILLMFSTLWSFCILCFAIINTHEKSRQRYEADFARSIISSGREHYQKMNELYDEISILRHDYKYQMNVIGELLNSGNTDEIINYLAGAQAQLSENELGHYCSNAVINALLSNYAERCRKLNINFDIALSMPEKLCVPNYEICIILGNLLENAVEACQKHEHGRKIELAVKQNVTQLLIMVKNSFDGVIVQEDGLPVSTKKDGGYGLRSVKAVASRYGGYLLTEWDSRAFTAYVAVML